MPEIIKINDNIHKINLPYKDIFTTVCSVKTSLGVLIFDAASFEGDTKNYISPMLDELKIKPDEVKYIFISHNHKDHAGDLKNLLSVVPNATVLSRSAELKEKYSDFNVVCPNDGDSILNVLKIVTIPGHTQDSMAILDTRTNTLLTGDSLQVYGIFGSEDWGSNICMPAEHLEAIKKVRALNVSAIYTAHYYHPCGVKAVGADEVNFLLDSCIEPIERVKKLVLENPSKSVEEIRLIYNSNKKVPPINGRLIEGTVKAIEEKRM